MRKVAWRWGKAVNNGDAGCANVQANVQTVGRTSLQAGVQATVVGRA